MRTSLEDFLISHQSSLSLTSQKGNSLEHWAPKFFKFSFFSVKPINLAFLLKGAEATCAKIATEMKKCFRLKEMSNFNVL